MKRLLPFLLVVAALAWGWRHAPEPRRVPFSRIVAACHAWRSPALYQSCVRQVGVATGWEVSYIRCDTCQRDAEGRIHRSSGARHAFMVETGHPRARANSWVPLLTDCTWTADDYKHARRIGNYVAIGALAIMVIAAVIVSWLFAK